jgi:diaminopimelate epimerase
MLLKFYKYQGTGNDFVMIDNRLEGIRLVREQVAFLCDRRFGVGADGLILLENEPGHDFKMVYYNSDGRESSMCGNGGRCITQFAFHLGIKEDEYRFLAIDGLHLAKREDSGIISLKMIDVGSVSNVLKARGVFVDTGSPHYVEFQEGIDELNLVSEARIVRYSDEYKEEGVNVNYVELQDSEHLKMRTYERGVEDETFSCGTGVTAAVLGAYSKGIVKEQRIHIKTKGGDLSVTFKPDGKSFKEIWLTGAADFVYKGEIEL